MPEFTSHQPGTFSWPELATHRCVFDVKPPHMPPDMPSFWLPYFLVTDVDASAAKATSLGAQIHVGPPRAQDASR